MQVVIGIDVGGSTTKIVGFNEKKELIAPMFVRAADPLTSIYGAFGKFTAENGIDLSDIRQVMVTGVGSTYITKPIYGLACKHVSEFDSAGLGGLYLSGLDHAVVVSMGTGTAIIHARRNEAMQYLGGTGVGGGTLMGLSKKMLGLDTIDSLVELAADGDLAAVDLRISDITNKDILPGMSQDMTAANFGKISDLASRKDLALGLFNMIFESIGMLAIFASRSCQTQDIVLSGNMTTVPQAKIVFENLNQLFKVNFLIPPLAQFATVIGAALLEVGLDKEANFKKM